MSGQDLMQEMGAKSALLDAALRQFGTRGREAANAEKDYRIALAKQIAIERANGTPVTIIGDVCRGDPEIARLKFQRDVAEVVYKSAMEAINSYKLQIRVLEGQINREWKG
jgi:hypothetical protein